MSRLRAVAVLAGFAGLTLPLMPVQGLLLRYAPAKARVFPNWYHRRVCSLLGIRLNISGEVAQGPVLLVSNHTSWLDIPVLSAVAPVSFVAKREVAGWPFVGELARLQRTVLVDRERRASVGDTTGEIRTRLAAGDKLVLFAEGTSSDGNRVLPFRSSLFGAVIPSRRGAAEAEGETAGAQPAMVQTVTLAYTRLHGVPLARADRPLVGWYGDMEMGSHAWQLLQAGPLDVEIRIGAPVPLERFTSRKELAEATETEVRQALARILLERDEEVPLEVVKPAAERRAEPVRSPDGVRRPFT